MNPDTVKDSILERLDEVLNLMQEYGKEAILDEIKRLEKKLDDLESEYEITKWEIQALKCLYGLIWQTKEKG